MKLKHIKEENCVECGSLVVTETQNMQHTNGKFNEERRFACGRTIHYYPNFDKIIKVLAQCSQSKAMYLRNKKRARLYEKLIVFIDSSKVDNEYKEALKSKIRFA